MLFIPQPYIDTVLQYKFYLIFQTMKTNLSKLLLVVVILLTVGLVGSAAKKVTKRRTSASIANVDFSYNIYCTFDASGSETQYGDKNTTDIIRHIKIDPARAKFCLGEPNAIHSNAVSTIENDIEVDKAKNGSIDMIRFWLSSGSCVEISRNGFVYIDDAKGEDGEKGMVYFYYDAESEIADMIDSSGTDQLMQSKLKDLIRRFAANKRYNISYTK